MVSDSAYLEKDVLRYIGEGKLQGYPDKEIMRALQRQGISASLIEKSFASFAPVKGVFLSKKWIWILFGGFFFLLLLAVLAFLYFVPPVQHCETSSDCASGFSCYQGECVRPIGFFNCQKELDCKEGYSCYTCLNP